MPVMIRPAIDGDIPALMALAAEWGYPSDVGSVRERLARLAASETDMVRVAQAEDGAVAGWIHAAEHRTLASPAVCEILGLVVGVRHRGRGIGRRLVEAAGEWAAQRGFQGFVVRSNVVRPEAHAFYQRLGFTRTKTQHVYARAIG